ncbi:MAG: ATP-dependent DNA ligase [Candidatus Lokiarchaeota archaeon]|nr:ATP-dependent DNA ligase [Candidatus Lokiarchaeota archaeon]
MKLTKDKIETSFHGYLRGKSESLPYSDLAKKIDFYRKNITQRFLTRREEDIIGLPGKNFIASVKVDGAFTGYYYDEKKDESIFFNTPTHRVFLGLPINDEMKQIMKKKGIKSALFMGEMHASTTTPIDFNARSTVYDLMRYRRNPSSDEDLERIGFRVFDVVEIDGKDWLEKEYRERHDKLSEIFEKDGRIAPVRTKSFSNTHDLQEYYFKTVVKGGHEGLIVRAGHLTLKIKPIHTLDVAIIAIAEGRQDSRLGENQLATALVALRYPDGNYQVLTRVGGGLTDDQRREIWSQFEIIESRSFITTTRDGRAMKMVKPQLVGQLEYLDIITDHEGEPIMQPSLFFDKDNNEWKMIRLMPFVKLIHPRFIETDPIRSDKDASNIEDVRISQITDLLDIQVSDSVKELKLKSSKVLAKAVYDKGDNAIKKFMAWKTNKGDSGYFPEYIVYFLDYSNARKDPLKRGVRITNNLEQMWKIYDGWIKEEMMGTKGDLKRGWAEYAVSDNRT